jgi:GTP1/Obg family GTP-binding protein
MIEILFKFASEVIYVRVDKTNVYFMTNNTGRAYATIDNLQLNYAGVCKEHPDLVDAKDWREQVINRFKEKIKNMKTEDESVQYLIEDLSKFGYKPLWKQKQGFRAEKLK